MAIKIWGLGDWEMGRLGDWEMGRLGDWEMGRLGDWEMGSKKKMKVRTHEDLEVYQIAFKAAMDIFELSKRFPMEERYSLTDQIRRFSRSVCANLAEAWRKRRYKAAFIAKLSDSEAEAAEVQVWLKFAIECNYLEVDTARSLYKNYNRIIGSLVNMIHNADKWLL